MTRLPVSGQDNGTWGNILNDYLSQSLTATGTLKSEIITDAQLSPTAAITKTKLATNVQTSLNNADLAPRKTDLVFNVRDYGAVGNGVTDDAAAIQATVDAAVSGGTVYFPIGFYRVATTIYANKPIIFQGAVAGYDGSGKGSGISVPAGVCAFTCDSHKISFMDLMFLANTTEALATAAKTWAIKFQTGHFCSVERCRFTYFYYSIWFVNCQFWTVADCYLQLCAGYHILIQDIAIPDGGDQNLRGNVFHSGTTTWPGLAQVRQESGGGVRVVGNKFFQGAIGYQVAVADAVSTSILLMSSNSFELQSYACIHLTSGGIANTGHFGRIVVTGNQFTGLLVSQAVMYCDTNAGQYTEIVFNSNACVGTSGSTIFVRMSTIRGLTAVNNYFDTGLTAIYLYGGSSHAMISPNHNYGLTGANYRFDNNNSGSSSKPTLMEETKNFLITSTVTYSQLVQLSFNAIGGCVLEITVIGNLTGGSTGGIVGYFKRAVTLPAVGSSLIVTTIGTDTFGAIPFDILFDTTTTTNNVYFKMRRNVSDGGTTVEGSVSVKVLGNQQILG